MTEAVASAAVGRVVAAVDGDGEDARAGGPVAVDDRAGEDVLQAYPERPGFPLPYLVCCSGTCVQVPSALRVSVPYSPASAVSGWQDAVVVGVRVIRRRQNARQRQIRARKGRRGKAQ